MGDITDKLETRLAVLEAKEEAEREDLHDIKKEVHEINTYLRNELKTQVDDIRQHERTKRQERSIRLQIFGAFGFASASIIITLLHIFL